MPKVPLYVNLPGGVVVHENSGQSITLAYGDVVPDNLAEYVDPTTFADSRPRTTVYDPEHDAKVRAAQTAADQVGSSASAVPGDYAELDEDEAVTLVRSYANRPAEQAAVIRHEIAIHNGGRLQVVDSISPEARAIVESFGLGAVVTPDPEPVAPSKDPEPVQAPPPVGSPDAESTTVPDATSDTPAPDADVSDGLDDLDYAGLKSFIDAEGLDVPKNIGKDDMVVAIRKAKADQS